MSYALLFPGQASQHEGMLPWLEFDPACAPALAEMTRWLGADWRARLANDDERSNNPFAQIVMTGSCLAAWAALAPHLANPASAVAGYSVGELAAFACAGVFSAHQAIALAQQRALAMDAAAAGRDMGLLSVTGQTKETVLRHCANVECAIDIGHDQGIYAGPSDSLEACAVHMATLGAQARRLAIKVASHSSWMHRASQSFAAALDVVSMRSPSCTVALNATGTMSRQLPVLRLALSEQISATVQWATCMDSLAERGIVCVMEIGPGNALAKMWNARHPEIPARSLSEFRDVRGAADWLNRASRSSLS